MSRQSHRLRKRTRMPRSCEGISWAAPRGTLWPCVKCAKANIRGRSSCLLPSYPGGSRWGQAIAPALLAFAQLLRQSIPAMLLPRLASAVQSVSAGGWAVGVSGGADSVALLDLLRSRRDLALRVVHLDHQARGRQSAADAAFVADLSARWNLPCSLATRDQLEASTGGLPNNLSARFRALRLILFQQVVRDHQLSGVIVAHHADDQAETVLHRLLRGSGYEGLCGMSRATSIGELRVLRPLLRVPRTDLRALLHSIGQTWREDPSNATDKYLRNRLRRFLAADPVLTQDLLRLASACRKLRRWARGSAPRLEESFAVHQLADLPLLLARQSARSWMIDRGVPPGDITPQSLDQLVLMAADAASPARANFPGSLLVRRRRGQVLAECHPPRL